MVLTYKDEESITVKPFSRYNCSYLDTIFMKSVVFFCSDDRDVKALVKMVRNSHIHTNNTCKYTNKTHLRLKVTKNQINVFRFQEFPGLLLSK